MKPIFDYKNNPLFPSASCAAIASNVNTCRSAVCSYAFRDFSLYWYDSRVIITTITLKICRFFPSIWQKHLPELNRDKCHTV